MTRLVLAAAAAAAAVVGWWLSPGALLVWLLAAGGLVGVGAALGVAASDRLAWPDSDTPDDTPTAAPPARLALPARYPTAALPGAPAPNAGTPVVGVVLHVAVPPGGGTPHRDVWGSSAPAATPLPGTPRRRRGAALPPARTIRGEVVK